MRRFAKVAAIIVAVAACIVLGAVVYIVTQFPNTDAPVQEKVTITPARLERGKYLANHVTVCIDCHSTRDWKQYAGPIIPGSTGKGGERFDEQMGGVPGVLYARNITPAAIGSWTDGELMRVITNGVTKDNRAIFPLMPYMAYQHLTKEDLYSLVAYIRSLHPIENSLPESTLDFPMNFIVRTIPPKTYTPQQEPDTNNALAYGKYLVQIAACADCHTPAEKGKQLPGMGYAGGFVFKFPAGVVHSANITPDKATGIGKWTKEQFIARFKSFSPDSAKPVRVDIQTEFNTPMPWTMYAGMTDRDLAAIYEYLQTIPPVKNNVTRFIPNK